MATERIEFRAIRRRFRTPLQTGAGMVESVDRVLLRGTRPDGQVGYGEVAPWPGFATESAEQALAALRACQGDLGQLRAATRTQPLPALAAAISMIDRWGDIAAFGGALPCAALLPAGATPAEAAQRAAQGWKTLKLKITPETPLEAAQGILAATPSEVKLRVDANGSLNLVRAREWVTFARGEPRMEYVEQPLPVDHAGYVSLGPAKVALDESFLLAAHALRWAGLVVAKPALVGDWTAFLGWAQAERERIVCSSCFETAIGRQAALWFAGQIGGTRAVGFDTLGWFEADGRDRHAVGPLARGEPGLDWEAFWREAS